MRIIKFRAWDRASKQMFDGNNIIGPRADYTVATHQPSIWRLNEFLYELSKGMTLLQATGIEDENGKEIYEGDVVKNSDYEEDAHCYNEWTRVIQWNKEMCGFTGIEGEQVEIIGNIYENPELLKYNE